MIFAYEKQNMQFLNIIYLERKHQINERIHPGDQRVNSQKLHMVNKQ